MGSQSFVHAVTVHTRVVKALILRETRTRFGKSRLGYLWALIEPMLHVGTFVVLFKVSGRTTVAGHHLELFFLTGVSVWLLFSNTQSKVAAAIAGNKNLLAYPPVTLFDIVVARILLEFAATVTVFVLLSCTFAAMGMELFVSEPLLVMYAMFLAAITGGGLGMILCAAKFYIVSIDKIVAAVLRLMYFGSGIFFSVSSLPASMRDYALLNPIAHFIEMTRAGFFHQYASPGLDIGFATTVAAVMFLLGLRANLISQSKVAG